MRQERLTMPYGRNWSVWKITALLFRFHSRQRVPVIRLGSPTSRFLALILGSNAYKLVEILFSMFSRLVCTSFCRIMMAASIILHHQNGDQASRRRQQNNKYTKQTVHFSSLRRINQMKSPNDAIWIRQEFSAMLNIPCLAYVRVTSHQISARTHWHYSA